MCRIASPNQTVHLLWSVTDRQMCTKILDSLRNDNRFQKEMWGKSPSVLGRVRAMIWVREEASGHADDDTEPRALPRPSGEATDEEKGAWIMAQLIHIHPVQTRINLKSVCSRSLLQMQQSLPAVDEDRIMRADVFVCGPSQMVRDLEDLRVFYRQQTAETYIRITSVRSEIM